MNSSSILAAELFGREVFDSDGFAILVSGLVLNLIVAAVTIGVLYYPDRRDREHAFMMFTMNLIVFLVSYFMNEVELGVGFGFGLFALFGIMRYRTETIPVREMAYLFAVIALGLVNGVGANQMTIADVLIANGVVVAVLALLSRVWWGQAVDVREILYERIDNIRPERRAELYWDLWERTGLTITDVEVVSVNFMNDTALLRVFHKPSGDGEGTPAPVSPTAERSVER